jgi:Flp pilus assembly pilin Flp
VKNLIVRFVREDAGQDLIEYGLLIGLITVGSIAAVIAIGTKVTSIWTNANTVIQTIPSGS